MNTLLAASLPCALLVFASLPRTRMQLDPWQHQNVDQCLPYDPQNTIVWPEDPSFGSAAGFGRTLVGDLDGDQTADAVVLADGVAVVLWGVAAADAIVRIEFDTESAPVDVSDMALLPEHGPDGQDALVLSDERGLYVVTYAQGSFGDPVAIGDGALAFAHKVHVDDLNGDGQLDVLALGADRRSVFQSLNDGGAFSTSLVLIQPYNCFDVLAVNWDHVGARELVAVCTRGLIVHDFAGTLLGGSVHNAFSGCIARVSTGGVAGGEIVAWTRPTNGGPSQLLLESATLDEGPWPLRFDFCGTATDIHPSAILAGRYDEDANDDLLLVHQGGPTAVVLANLGALDLSTPGDPAGPHFDPTNTNAFDVLGLGESEAPGGVGLPVFEQVDGVASEDIVVPVVGTGQVEVFLLYPHARAILGSGITSETVTSERTEFGPDDHEDNRLRLAFEVPDLFADFTHIELKVWLQTNDPQQPTPVEPVALDHVRFPLLVDAGLVWPLRQWVEVEPSFPDFDQNLTCWQNPKPNYFVQFRFSRLLSSGNYQKSPIYTGGFTLQDCDETTSYNYLVMRGIVGASFELYADNGLSPDSPEGIDRNQLGLYIPMSSKPPFETGITPTAPPIRDIPIFAHPFAQE